VRRGALGRSASHAVAGMGIASKRKVVDSNTGGPEGHTDRNGASVGSGTEDVRYGLFTN